MKKVLLTIVLLLGVGTIKSQVRKETFKNVFVTNAALAGISGDEALKNTKLVTSKGSTILFDKAKKMITIKVHLPEKTDVLKIEEITEDETYVIYSCTGTEGQGKVMVFEYKKEDCIMMGFADAGVIFVFTDLDKGQMLGLY
ncbi:MAG: hypothetical protein LUH12_08130 [Bacteroides sp.]|nr:hypothetical protein [Bacteroides sp.]